MTRHSELQELGARLHTYVFSHYLIDLLVPQTGCSIQDVMASGLVKRPPSCMHQLGHSYRHVTRDHEPVTRDQRVKSTLIEFGEQRLPQETTLQADPTDPTIPASRARPPRPRRKQQQRQNIHAVHRRHRSPQAASTALDKKETRPVVVQTRVYASQFSATFWGSGVQEPGLRLEGSEKKKKETTREKEGRRPHGVRWLPRCRPDLLDRRCFGKQERLKQRR